MNVNTKTSRFWNNIDETMNKTIFNKDVEVRHPTIEKIFNLFKKILNLFGCHYVTKELINLRTETKNVTVSKNAFITKFADEIATETNILPKKVITSMIASVIDELNKANSKIDVEQLKVNIHSEISPPRKKLADFDITQLNKMDSDEKILTIQTMINTTKTRMTELKALQNDFDLNPKDDSLNSEIILKMGTLHSNYILIKVAMMLNASDITKGDDLLESYQTLEKDLQAVGIIE